MLEGYGDAGAMHTVPFSASEPLTCENGRPKTERAVAITNPEIHPALLALVFKISACPGPPFVKFRVRGGGEGGSSGTRTKKRYARDIPTGGHVAATDVSRGVFFWVVAAPPNSLLIVRFWPFR